MKRSPSSNTRRCRLICGVPIDMHVGMRSRRPLCQTLHRLRNATHRLRGSASQLMPTNKSKGMSLSISKRCGVHIAVLACATSLGSISCAQAVELVEPLLLQSKHGVLDLLMVARPAPVPALSPYVPTGWVYEICPRPLGGVDRCPDDAPGVNYYGGTRLALNAGDVLKIHFINRLPPITDSDHASDPDEGFLALNPTNVHTHGLLVSPHAPSADDPTYGDNVFVLTFNPMNGEPVVSPHLHAAVQMGSTDYTIKIPANHPSGLYWFHPHAHGISLNQMSAGLSGILTIGSVGDYVCADSACSARGDQFPVRHLILKDTQVLKGGTVQTEEDPDFCLTSSPPAAGITLGAGGCSGTNQSDDGGGDYRGGRWFFTVNGQVVPTMTVKAPLGEIWRITNASGSASYDLQLFSKTHDRSLVMQVLSIDGVSVAPASNTSPADFARIAGQKLNPVHCPGLEPGSHLERNAEPLCVASLRMMPSSRAEVWVTYRSADQRPAAPSANESVVLRTVGVQTGPGGDTWPPIDLANISFAPGSAGSLGKSPAVDFLAVRGDAKRLMTPAAISGDLYSANTAVAPDPTCHALAPGHRRRIFFNVPASNPDAFGLGYEELDAQGQPVPGTFQDVAQFDPMRPTVCLPLGPGNTSVKEVWELVNLANEDHNFHIHQVHFRVVSAAELDGTRVPNRVLGDGITMDGLPLEHTDGTCATVQDWRNGVCTAYPAVIEIPFAIAGDFVYHCHILEHEDGGMMARIRVRPNNGDGH